MDFFLQINAAANTAMAKLPVRPDKVKPALHVGNAGMIESMQLPVSY